MKLSALCMAAVVILAFPFASFAAEPDSIAGSRRKGTEIVASAATSIAVNAALTEILKGTVHEVRPDRSDNNSFPSRHTSWAFTASSVISRELYRYSPWWSVGAQTLASAVGLQRVRDKRHYGSDVVAGAVLGIISTEVSYLLMERIFRPEKRTVSYSNDFRPGIAVASEAVYALSRVVRTGFGIVMRGQLPFSEKWGAVMSLRTSSAPVRADAGTVGALNDYGAVAGAMGHFRLPADCLAVEASLQAGAVRLESTAGYCSDLYAFETDCDIALSWRLTEKFSARATLGYRLVSRPDPVSAITVGISSVAHF